METVSIIRPHNVIGWSDHRFTLTSSLCIGVTPWGWRDRALGTGPSHHPRSHPLPLVGLARSGRLCNGAGSMECAVSRHLPKASAARGMAVQQVANRGDDDLLVTMAFAPYSPPVVDVVRDAYLRGLTIIAMTDTPPVRRATHSTVAFCVDNEVTGQFRPISGAIGLVQTIILRLGAALIGSMNGSDCIGCSSTPTDFRMRSCSNEAICLVMP